MNKNECKNLLYLNKALKNETIITEQTENGLIRVSGTVPGILKSISLLLLSASCVQSVEYLCDDKNQAYRIIKVPIHNTSNFEFVRKRINRKLAFQKGHNVSFTISLSIFELFAQLDEFADYMDFVENGLHQLALYLNKTYNKEEKLYLAKKFSHGMNHLKETNHYRQELLKDEFFLDLFEICDICYRLLSKERGEDFFIENCPSDLIVICEECNLEHIKKCRACVTHYGWFEDLKPAIEQIENYLRGSN